MTAPKRVLIIEDDPDDVLLLRQALERAEAPVALSVASDGGQGLAILRGEERPGLVILDWRLPGRSGLEVLRDIRADRSLRLLPVIVLTTSGSERDVRDAYEAGANCFVTKPTGLAAMGELARALSDLWLVHARLPGLAL